MSELFSTVAMAHRALDYHARRQNILASNLANVDTPGFRALEIVRRPGEDSFGKLALARTRSDHLRRLDAKGVAGEEILEDPTATVGIDGNAVALEREMAKLAANDLRYHAVAGMVRRKLGELRYVANDGRG